MISASSIFFILLLFVATVSQTEPVTGAEFDHLAAAQFPEVQQELIDIFPESAGYLILGSLGFCERLSDKLQNESPSDANISGDFRLICSSIKTHSSTNARLHDTSGFGARFIRIDSLSSLNLFCFTFESGNQSYRLWGYTVNSMRKNIWDVQTYTRPDYFKHKNRILNYSEKVEQALAQRIAGEIETELPIASQFDLPMKFDFYAPPPDFIISGYQNYKDFMNQHALIDTDFAHDVYEFKPSDSLLNALKVNVVNAGYPNKEAARLQHEFKDFFERGGRLQSMNSLTTAGFDTLNSGEYFFAISLSGRVRFGRELAYDEVKRIEVETGITVPRANHAFLFPGEPVLTAGLFYIEIIDGRPRLVKVNADSGHYFYSNITPSIREDIIKRSNQYLLTLGHFFNTLDQLQIPYDGITISKF